MNHVDDGAECTLKKSHKDHTKKIIQNWEELLIDQIIVFLFREILTGWARQTALWVALGRVSQAGWRGWSFPSAQPTLVECCVHFSVPQEKGDMDREQWVSWRSPVLIKGLGHQLCKEKMWNLGLLNLVCILSSCMKTSWREQRRWRQILHSGVLWKAKRVWTVIQAIPFEPHRNSLPCFLTEWLSTGSLCGVCILGDVLCPVRLHLEQT